MADYSKMSDMVINGLVMDALSDGNQYHRPSAGSAIVLLNQVNPGDFAILPVERYEVTALFDPCNSWADAGPIATKNRISINAHGRHKWLAWKNKGETLTQMADRKNLLSVICENPCRAICIVFLVMVEGE